MADYSNYDKPELLEIIAKYEKELKSKKYGLVWDSEREPEQVVLDCENNLPILKRIKSKEIKTDDKEDNILIEGDNYHALTVLNYTHKEKIDVIYIDPPYNTGNKDFTYNDRFVEKEDGYRHSKWLNFMEKRLNLANELLKKTGVIFISIDDNEFAQLKLLCDTIFGSDNFIQDVIWNSRKSVSNDAIISLNHNHTLIFAKHKATIREEAKKHQMFKIQINEGKFDNPDNDPLGKWVADPFDAPNLRPNLTYKIINPNTGDEFWPPKGRCWRTTSTEYYKFLKDGKIIFGKTGKTKPQLKRYLFEAKKKGSVSKSIWDDVDTTTHGTKEVEEILGEKKFNNPKPISLLNKILQLTTGKNSTILDFMAGSGTTGHAVLQLNKEDGGNRKFILCTNNENKICTEVTYPRIKKVITGYKKNGNGELVEGLKGNLQYFETALIKKTKNRDQVKINLTQKCTEMLCVKENIFNIETSEPDFKIFSSNKNNRFLCIYYNYIEDSFGSFLEDLKKLKGKKLIYMFSEENDVDKSLFSEIKNKTIEIIPQEILTVYKQLVKMNISIKTNVIFSDLNKAKTKIFTDKDKDDGARILRVVLEKIIQKISQDNSINILNAKGKEEKISVLNDKLFNQNVITKVEYVENRNCLTIGNNAAHGDYDDYNLKQVEKNYKHIQSLLNNYNI